VEKPDFTETPDFMEIPDFTERTKHLTSGYVIKRLKKLK
jgi:hypothetical protein